MKQPDVPNDMVRFNDTIQALAKRLNKNITVQIPLYGWFIRLILVLLGRRVNSWAKHCARHPYFEYKSYAPNDFGQPVAYPTFESVLNQMKI